MHQLRIIKIKWRKQAFVFPTLLLVRLSGVLEMVFLLGKSDRAFAILIPAPFSMSSWSSLKSRATALFLFFLESRLSQKLMEMGVLYGCTG